MRRSSTSYRKLVQEARCEAARELLHGDDASITEVAMDSYVAGREGDVVDGGKYQPHPRPAIRSRIPLRGGIRNHSFGWVGRCSAALAGVRRFFEKLGRDDHQFVFLGYRVPGVGMLPMLSTSGSQSGNGWCGTR